MNLVKAEVMGMKKGDNHVIITINGAPTFAARLLTSHAQREMKDGYVEIWIDFHGQQRFIGYQNPYDIYKLVNLLYSNFMTVKYYENGELIDILRWVEENTYLYFDEVFETVEMDL